VRPKKNPFSLSAGKESDRLADIYRAAAQVICDKGYSSTSMNDIAEAVGLTKAGIYHHISGKQDLLFHIMNFGMDALEEEVILPARAILDPEDRLRTVIANHVQLITDRSTPQGNSPVSIVVDEVAELTPTQRRKINQRKREYVDFLCVILNELKAQGKLEPIDVTVAAFSLLGTILWLSRWYSPEGRLSPVEIGEEITKITLGGLLRRPPL
jgi:AcrR family transcriptional regulator